MSATPFSSPKEGVKLNYVGPGEQETESGIPRSRIQVEGRKAKTKWRVRF